MKILPNHILTSGVSLNQRSLVDQLKDASNESQSNQHNQIKASQKRSRDELNDLNEIEAGHNIDNSVFLNPNMMVEVHLNNASNLDGANVEEKKSSQSKRQKVDLETGKPSDAEDAIPKSTYYYLKKKIK